MTRLLALLLCWQAVAQPGQPVKTLADSTAGQDQRFDASGEKDGPATLFVRPHDLTLTPADQGLPATVVMPSNSP